MTFTFNKNTEESVILSIQDHWIVLLKPVILLVCGVTLFVFLAYIAMLFKPNSWILGLVFMLLGLFFLVVCVHFFFVYLLHWSISGLVFTTKRIIDLRFFPYVEDDVIHAEIFNINEIEKWKHGVFRNLLNYGDLIIRLPGKTGMLDFKNVPHPGRISNLLENIRLHRPVEKKDFQHLGAIFSKKYSFLDPYSKDEEET